MPNSAKRAFDKQQKKKARKLKRSGKNK